MTDLAAPPADGPLDECDLSRLHLLVHDYLLHEPGLAWKQVQMSTNGGGERTLSCENMLWYVVRKHALEDKLNSFDKKALSQHNVLEPSKEFQCFVLACNNTLKLIAKLQSICNHGMELYKMFLPTKVSLIEHGATEIYDLQDLDDEGRPIYKCEEHRKSAPSSTPLLSRCWLRWHQLQGKAGCWAARTDKCGESPGDLQLDSALVTDVGTWRRVESQALDGGVSVKPVGEPLVAQWNLTELREVFFRGARGAGSQAGQLTVRDCAKEVLKIVAGLFEENGAVEEHLCRLLRAMCEVAEMLSLGGVEEPVSSKFSDLFRTLVNLAELGDRQVHSRLRQELPGYDKSDKKKELLTQCMICNCRLLDICDLRSTEQSNLPRLFHQLCLRSWQERHRKQVRLLDLGCDDRKPSNLLRGDEEGLEPLGDKHANQVRFVVLSDTHGWDSDLDVPEGDVLLHCGDLLFESGHASKGDHLAATLKCFEQKYSNFKRIFVVGGSHDQPLYDLWCQNQEKLFTLLPENLVLLQAHTDFGDHGQLKSSGAAQKAEDRNCIQHGAVWLKPVLKDGKLELILDKPAAKHKYSEGWIIAGSGVSLANNAWSPNRAFQLDKPAGDPSTFRICQEAADALLWHEPDIVMSYGPPKALEGEEVQDESGGKAAWDEGGGDEALREALQRCNSWKVVLFGHKHEHHGLVYALEGRRPFVNAAITTPLYVPARPPIVFDLTVALDRVQSMNRSHSAVVGLLPWGPQVNSAVSGLLQWGRQVSAPCLARCCDVADRILGGCQQKLSSHISNALSQHCRPLLILNWGYYHEALILGWVPQVFVLPEVRELWQRKQDEAAQEAREQAAERGLTPEAARREEERARQRAKLSEFQVAGPAVLYGFQSVWHWGFAMLLTIAAFLTTGERSWYVLQAKPQPDCWERGENECPAFLEYPMWLWCPFIPVFWHLWKVQMKCLSYVILPQVHLLSTGFDVFGVKVSFRTWEVFIFGVSLTSMMDIATQCLFYGQFLKSAQSDTRISKVWAWTIESSFTEFLPVFSDIVSLFTWCWSMMFTQLLYMAMHMFTTHDRGVSHEFESMPQGYTTLASHLFRFQVHYESGNGGVYEGGSQLSRLTVKDCWRSFWYKTQLPKGQLFKYWHADVLRILALYGRMAALTWMERALMVARLQQELDKGNMVRFLQIMFYRLKEFVFRILLIDIFEKALKLEIQVSVFAIDLALQPNQTSKLRVANKQMLLAIALTVLSVVYSLWIHIHMWWSLVCKRRQADPQHCNHCNLQDCIRNYERIRDWLACYLLCIIILLAVVGHAMLKFQMAFLCQFSMWNWGGNCVVFAYAGTEGNRTLILPNA